uniref:F-box domain-containing protein n=1 Tax=Wuchereria bancrofti TaxID=6293 RepID=A0A1I8EII0_WUCBA
MFVNFQDALSDGNPFWKSSHGKFGPGEHVPFQRLSEATMSALQDRNGNDIVQDESKGLLSLLDEIIIRIIEKLSSEDIANIADTCIKLREVVRKMTAGDERTIIVMLCRYSYMRKMPANIASDSKAKKKRKMKRKKIHTVKEIASEDELVKNRLNAKFKMKTQRSNDDGMPCLRLTKSKHLYDFLIF